MNQPNRDNVVMMRTQTHCSVIPMPSRERALRASAAVIRMPSPFPREEEQASTVITMPARTAQSAGEPAAKSEEPALAHISSAVRLTLLALFTWLGWPRPTHGKDPGAAGARPWKPARLSLISSLHLSAALAGRKEAAIVDFPATAREFDAASVMNLHAA